KVEVRAAVGLYAARGDFQLNVEVMRKAGVGNLYEAFLKLKAKLESEGLFDPSRKRSLPEFPRVIGVVTSPQAAALRDLINAFRRRSPHIQLIVYPTLVQGTGSADQIAHAINTASARAECDLLIVARGGGSLEDLWSFNDERVARAIAACKIPVISGVGHETDVTIADFVADLRAPTPTAAAELAATSHQDWLERLAELGYGLQTALRRHLDDRAQSLDWLSRRLQSPTAAVRQHELRLAALQTRLRHAGKAPLAQLRFTLTERSRQLWHGLPNTGLLRAQLAAQSLQISTGFAKIRATAAHRRESLRAQLELLAPQRTLERGYAIVQDAEGRILRDTADLAQNESIELRLAKGQAQIKIAKISQR
ncbi:MAG: exodeoxyribonuclease VII large subunit, partial [Sphingomonadales bacterium]|nr:exodeoxyribonuclease VII large subunit [Sphingomonadales bacterium]